MWLADSDDLLEYIDQETISPSDFTVKLEVRRGMGRCCATFPFTTVGSGQILAFVDNLSETKIFTENQEYWKEDVAFELNKEFDDKNQLSKILYNEDSPYDIKSCLAVKKLDNSIYQFINLVSLSKQIIRHKSKIYQDFKKENPEEDEQYLNDLANNFHGDEPTLNRLMEEYQQRFDQLSKFRKDAVEYDKLETLHA